MKRITLLFIFFTGSHLLAHEFWLHPIKFIYKRGEPINVKFLVGENYNGENWKGDGSRIESLKFYFSDVSDDLSNFITDEIGDSLQVALFDEGTAMIAFHSNNAFIEMEAGKFNQYLREEGLLQALKYREDHKQIDNRGREFYQRNVKTLIQVGAVKTNVWKKPTGFPVDIIPIKNPYELRNGDSLAVKILFENTPVSNTLVKLWHRVHNSTEKKELITNKNGIVSFPILTSGRWMVSTVKMTRIEKKSRANWQSYWGSLTWGYE